MNKKPDYVAMLKSGKSIFTELVNYETPKDFHSTTTQTGKQELLTENKMSYYLENMGVGKLDEEFDEWIDSLEEGAKKELAKHYFSGGFSGKYGAKREYKRLRKAGHGRLKSIGKIIKKSATGENDLRRKGIYHTDRARELTKSAGKTPSKASQRDAAAIHKSKAAIHRTEIKKHERTIYCY